MVKFGFKEKKNLNKCEMLCKIEGNPKVFTSKLRNNNSFTRAMDEDGDKFTIETYFEDLEKNLISHIQKAGFVFGVVYYLSSPTIIKNLATTNTSLIVQKENWMKEDRYNYSSLKCDITPAHFEDHRAYEEYMADCHFLPYMHNNGYTDPMEPIRVMGRINKNITPLVHSKFLIFAKIDEEVDHRGGYCGCRGFLKFCGKHVIQPYGLWHGSYNPTKNSNNSMNHATYTTNKYEINTFMNQYFKSYLASESLNNFTEEMRPQYLKDYINYSSI